VQAVGRLAHGTQIDHRGDLIIVGPGLRRRLDGFLP
jgi:hypothetical protein